MNARRLKIYLDDHLALMTGEIELIGRSHASNQDEPVGFYLNTLKAAVQKQRDKLSEIAQCLAPGATLAGNAKNMIAWLGEKMGRFKMNGTLLTYSPLSRLVELEALAALAEERRCLWSVLTAMQQTDQQLSRFELQAMADECEQQQLQLRTFVIDAGRKALLD